MTISCSDDPLWDVWMGAFHAPTLAIADEIGFFAALRTRPRSDVELARELDIEARAARAMAGLFTSLGLLVRDEDAYALTEISRTYLLPEGPFYWGGVLARIRSRPIDCKVLLAGLRPNGTGFVGELWEQRIPPVEQLVSFTHAMHAHSFGLATRIAARVPLVGEEHFLDVGAGSGAYSIAFAKHHPRLHATLVDLPAVCDTAARYVDQHQLADRVHVRAINMFEDAWPTGANTIWMSDIFHDYDDVRCGLLAERAFAALDPGGRLLVHEMLLDDDGDGPLRAASYSMLMVFVTRGRQRTRLELDALLQEAGFIDIEVIPTTGSYACISGRRP